MTTSTLEVGDLFSVLGAHGIVRQLQRVAGVGRVSVNPVSGSTTVVYDPGRTSLSAIRAAIQDCGFHCSGEALPRHVCDGHALPSEPRPGAPIGQVKPSRAQVHVGHAGMASADAIADHKAHGGEKRDAMAQEMGHGAGMDASRRMTRTICRLIEAICQRHPTLPQVACFDTGFHRTMPRVASLLPIPRRYDAAGVRRYGFHGLSYEFLIEELARLGDPAATKGRVILAHLGNGASLAAVRDGKSIDTSMGFTPTAGLVMSSRSGDLDPGLVAYLARTEQMSATQFQEMVNHASGLLGVSEISSDLRDLLARETDDVRAAEAVALFCYQAKKWIGSFAAALGGLDTLVFAGGIGENAPLVRGRICDGVGFLGIELNEGRNTKNASLISTDSGRVAVRVIRTDEELMIARSTMRVLGAPLDVAAGRRGETVVASPESQ
jgi:hypothetical protein